MATFQSSADKANTLDDTLLLQSLVKKAKSSHSNLGRSLDVSLSYRIAGGAEVQPTALSMNRLERARQLKAQGEQQAAWGAAECGTLNITTLATMAPSFTQAADEGVEALGGTKLGGAGHTSVIALVPTGDTVKCIEDDYELISSFRPYQLDALCAARQSALREVSAPHPDLLRQLAPTLGSVHPSQLVDTGALPAYLLQRADMFTASTKDAAGRAGDGEEDAAAGGGGAAGGCEGNLTRKDLKAGTYPFLCLGRDRGERRRLPGVRQPALGQYHPRFGEVELRVLGGYIAPQQQNQSRMRRGGADDKGDDCTNPLSGTDTLGKANGDDTDKEEVNSNFNGTFAATHLGAFSTIGAGFAGSATRGTGATGRATTTPLDKLAGDAVPRKPGENVKGSSMFLSLTERKMEIGSAAPDVTYWPYPDTRSTTKRVPCQVKMEVATTSRRREPPVSGVPTGAYDVAGNIAENLRNPVQMRQSTGRNAHWFGKKDLRVTAATEFLELDEALRATRPHERIVVLPPRTEHQPGSKDAEVDTTVSIERDLNFPKHAIGDPTQLTCVRAFDKMLTRAERENLRDGTPAAAAYSNVTNNFAGHGNGESDGCADALILSRSRSAVIHPHAPGHGTLSGLHANELGEPPNLKWVKPNTSRSTEFGVGCSRPDTLLPIHDLSYETDNAFKAIDKRVTGDPMISTTLTRQRREKVRAQRGCGANTMYDAQALPNKVKLVPDFEKQITKETQFCGRRVPSERWERSNPKAPGPGHYDLNYSQVE